MYRNLIFKPSSIKWQFNNVRCPQHFKRNKLCKIIVNQTKSKTTTIHDRYENFEVENYEIYCNDTPSRKSTILQFGAKLLSTSDSDDYITIENQKVYKIKSLFILSSLLFYFNDSTINGNLKMIGIFCIFI